MYAVFLLLSLGAFLASLMAFLITYEEYSHHYVGKQEPVKAALEAAAFTFCVFVVLSLLTAFFLTRAFLSQ